MLDQNLMLRNLPALVLEKLKRCLRMQTFAPGQVLVTTGEPITRVFFPCSGAVSLVCELSGGQMIETAMVGRDSLVGGAAALDDREATYKAIVQIGGAGFVLDAEAARHVAREHEDLRKAIMHHEQLILAQAQQSAACNASHNLNERLARWLLRTRDVLGGDSFLLTQEFMADMLGVRRTSVSIVAHSLQQAGLLSYRRGHIKIEKPEALQHAACECYNAIRMRYATALKTQATAAAAAPAQPSVLETHQRFA